MSASTVPFRKMNGLGNDFVVVDARRTPFAPSAEDARAIADRKDGIGCDQLIVLEKTPTADIRMRIWNAEGGEVESCGNAARCVADLLFAETGKPAVTIDTRGGALSATRAANDLVTVDMGAPRFGWRDIPLAEAFHDTRHIELEVGPLGAPILHSPSVVNVGNPHAIFWVADTEAVDLARIGPMLEHHPLFPARANISLAEMLGPDHIKLRVWERGAGLTRACGTAACAAAVCAARLNKTGREKVTISLPGGDLYINWRESDDHILMTGAVAYEFEGDLAPLLARARIPA